MSIYLLKIKDRYLQRKSTPAMNAKYPSDTSKSHSPSLDTKCLGRKWKHPIRSIYKMRLLLEYKVHQFN